MNLSDFPFLVHRVNIMLAQTVGQTNSNSSIKPGSDCVYENLWKFFKKCIGDSRMKRSGSQTHSNLSQLCSIGLSLGHSAGWSSPSTSTLIYAFKAWIHKVTVRLEEERVIPNLFPQSWKMSRNAEAWIVLFTRSDGLSPNPEQHHPILPSPTNFTLDTPCSQTTVEPDFSIGLPDRGAFRVICHSENLSPLESSGSIHSTTAFASLHYTWWRIPRVPCTAFTWLLLLLFLVIILTVDCGIFVRVEISRQDLLHMLFCHGTGIHGAGIHWAP